MIDWGAQIDGFLKTYEDKLIGKNGSMLEGNLRKVDN
jgi:hypothetical protein